MNVNEKKYKEYQKKKILRYLIIIFSLITIILESLALFKVISYIWGLIPFLIYTIIKYFYNDFHKEKSKKVKKDKKTIEK